LLLFPFMVTFLLGRNCGTLLPIAMLTIGKLVFLVIFEYVLGAFAEITCFADRHFYSDWWYVT
jgi:sterol O-acyltransferase